jgi:hypothetical protein
MKNEPTGSDIQQLSDKIVVLYLGLSRLQFVGLGEKGTLTEVNVTYRQLCCDTGGQAWSSGKGV